MLVIFLLGAFLILPIRGSYILVELQDKHGLNEIVSKITDENIVVKTAQKSKGKYQSLNIKIKVFVDVNTNEKQIYLAKYDFVININSRKAISIWKI